MHILVEILRPRPARAARIVIIPQAAAARLAHRTPVFVEAKRKLVLVGNVLVYFQVKLVLIEIRDLSDSGSDERRPIGIMLERVQPGVWILISRRIARGQLGNVLGNGTEAVSRDAVAGKRIGDIAAASI